MEEFETKQPDKEACEDSKKENNAKNTAGETSASYSSAYHENIPGPTKYDKAYRSYGDAAQSSAQPQGKGSNRQGFAIAALILGIVSAISIFIPIIGWIGGIATGIVGIVLGILGKKSSKRSFAIVGLVLSSIAIGICLLLLIWFFTMLAVTLLGYANNFKIPSEYSYFFRSVLPYMID